MNCSKDQFWGNKQIENADNEYAKLTLELLDALVEEIFAFLLHGLSY